MNLTKTHYMKKIVFILIIAAYSCNKSEPAKVKVAEHMLFDYKGMVIIFHQFICL